MYHPLDYLQSIWAVMIWLVLFKLQRYSHVDNAAVVRYQQRGAAKTRQESKNIYVFRMIKVKQTFAPFKEVLSIES